MAVGLGGVALVVSGALGGTGAPLWAYALPLAAVACLGTGTVLQRRWHMHDDLLQTLTMHSIVAGAVSRWRNTGEWSGGLHDRQPTPITSSSSSGWPRAFTYMANRPP